MSTNHHGDWFVRGTPEWRADLEASIGHKLAEDDDRVLDNSGPPSGGLASCNYCGSITPEDFVKACREGYRMEVADWKYGYPHKVYVDWPNPKPDELRMVGSTSQGSRPVFDEDTGAVARRVKTQEEAPAGFPVWSERNGWSYLGAYPLLHAKFYTDHLQGFDGLDDETSELIHSRTGVLFVLSDGKIRWSAQPPTRF